MAREKKLVATDPPKAVRRRRRAAHKRPKPGTVSPGAQPAITPEMILAVADRLGYLHGGNDILNQIEAELLLCTAFEVRNHSPNTTQINGIADRHQVPAQQPFSS